MRALAVSLGCLIAIASATPALALPVVQDEGIVSGAEMVWDGAAANANQIYIGAGNLLISGTFSGFGPVPFSTGAPQIVTKTVGGIAQTANVIFTTDVGMPVGGCGVDPAPCQSPSFAYYVYAANPNHAGVLQWIVSTYEPNASGEIWRGATYQYGGVQINANDTLFVGSYITDSAGNMIPFLKKGDEVILTPGVGTSTPLHQNTGLSSSVTFLSAPGYPKVMTLSLPLTAPAGANPSFVPLTASALILDFVMETTDNVAHDARILNPTLDTDVTAGVCTANPQYYLIAGLGAAGQPWPYNHARIQWLPGSATPWKIQVGGCAQPAAGKTYTVSAAFVGYVETTHHVQGL